MTDVVVHFRTRLAPSGMNLLGTTTAAAYDAGVPPSRRLAARFPGACAVIVIGNGGPALWRALLRTGASPDPDPLDRFTRAAVGAAAADVEGARCAFPFEWPAVPVDFRRLGLLAGLGGPSRLGVLVHPTFGPSMALRAAVVLPYDVAAAPGAALGFDPCPACIERPCVAACPVDALEPDGWDPARCATHRLAAPVHCAEACAARLACVVGRAHHYPPDALAHHQRAARARMVAYASAARKV